MVVSNDQGLQNIRQYFLKNGIVLSDEVRSEILNSWIRSENSVNSNIMKLPIPNYKESKKRYKEDWVDTQPDLADYVNKFTCILKKTQAAMFFLDNNLTIMGYDGNNQLLKKLISRNIRTGAVMKENIIGTNAAVLAQHTNEPAYVVGAEHYIDGLQEFGCCATPYRRNLNDPNYILYITYKELFHISHMYMINQFADILYTGKTIVDKSNELYMVYKLIDFHYNQSNDGLIIIDKKGKVIRTNNTITTMLGEDISDKNFFNCNISLNINIRNINDLKNIKMKTVAIGNNQRKKTLIMDCNVVNEGKKTIGAIITLFYQKRMQSVISGLANYNAYYNFDDLIGQSIIFEEIKHLAENAALSPSNVLITGESGTGKELFAQAIHSASNRAEGPFIAINCASIPRELIGSELFGYMDGAFTGARKGGMPGKFELANNGTIFLDEIGEMPLDMQAVLLRVLEERAVTRIGGHKQIPIDVKFVAATNRNLQDATIYNHFRKDLFYRLNVISIIIPPLRERREDILLLINHFINHFNRSFNKHIEGIEPIVMNQLIKYNWPGNVRELRNIIERAFNQTDSGYIKGQHIPRELLYNGQENIDNGLPEVDFDGYELEEHTEVANDYTPVKGENDSGEGEKGILYEYKSKEQKRIVELLLKFNGNKSRVAKEMGITRTTLYKKLSMPYYNETPE